MTADEKYVKKYKFKDETIYIIGGGEIYACKLATDMFKLEKKDLSEHVIDIITIGDFYALAGGENTQIIFT